MRNPLQMLPPYLWLNIVVIFSIPIILIMLFEAIEVSNIKSVSPSNKSECLAKGGNWDLFRCFIKTIDAGKICSSSLQCQGDCLHVGGNTASGQCSELNRNLGCNDFVEGGKIVSMCSD